MKKIHVQTVWCKLLSALAKSEIIPTTIFFRKFIIFVVSTMISPIEKTCNWNISWKAAWFNSDFYKMYLSHRVHGSDFLLITWCLIPIFKHFHFLFRGFWPSVCNNLVQDYVTEPSVTQLHVLALNLCNISSSLAETLANRSWQKLISHNFFWFLSWTKKFRMMPISFIPYHINVGNQNTNP
jgi:hypothetical protein